MAGEAGAADAERDIRGFAMQFYSLMSPEQQAVLFANTARAVDASPMEVKLRHIGN